MTDRRLDLPTSIRQRLLRHARQLGADHQLVLTRYAQERLLARLAASPLRDRFVLKGALLFTLWDERPHRPTRDLDLLGRGDPSIEASLAAFRQILATPVEPDGLSFDADGLAGQAIRPTATYEGVRLKLPARLGRARFRLQVDVGFGDAVEPRPRLVAFPTLLDHAAPRIRAYPREAAAAEKLQALVSLGVANSRMKDVHDLWTLATRHPFDGARLARGIGATFRRRRTDLPAGTPVCFTPAFTQGPEQRRLWSAFLERTDLDEPTTLGEALGTVEGFALPLLRALAGGRAWTRRWPPGGPWQARRS